ncbi:sigma-54-dependent Fis family transcriptional regulator [Hyphomicrobium sp.]|uniref:sigma-54-dependent Fis family transcriptional regulator n=1 Tax=Hyphomicrobium sp. TaxID=82 RepID=UPI0025C0B7F8|nr:sigma-54-dependent Fis family transcriptional regulator [Hyphomicrobium sp.]MCC7250504.1 sigma-54-dependent Fis family transcriptional regulator [Hyphomicrobium sp.]
MKSVLDDHVERVMQASVKSTIGDGSSAIQRSWHRCVNVHKLDPAAQHQAFIESPESLKQIKEQLGEFLQIARSGLERLSKTEAGYGYVILTNADGVIVDTVDCGSWLRVCADASVLPGANWNEKYVGTNGIGTCLVERASISCRHDDHFHTSQLGFSCSSAPLFAPDGTFTGVLNVSAKSTPQTRENITLAPYRAGQYAKLIENAYFVRHFKNSWVIRLDTANELLDVSSDALLAVDVDGVVVGANSDARRLLGAPHTGTGTDLSATLINEHLTSVFQCGYGDTWFLMRPQNTGERTILKSRKNIELVAMATPPSCAPSKPVGTTNRRPDWSAITQLAGDDGEMKRVLDQAQRLVNKKVHILLQGETGTGKEVLARALHKSSTRAQKTFVAVNCAAIAESLIESELFGYMAGAFTGARSKGMQGLIERSSGGTLFLDEIGDMPLHLQTRLLRVLSENEVQPLGSDKHVPVNLTVISASHRDLGELVSINKFREDLYYRLCGATLYLPPLRDRQDKIYIIYRVLHQEALQLGCRPWIDEKAMELLLRYRWPGNVRELRNAIRFALAVSDDGIAVEHLPPVITGGSVTPFGQSPCLVMSEGYGNSNSSVHEPASLLRACLRRNKWNITAVAAEMGLCRTSVYRQMKRFGIVPPTHL